MKIIDKIRKIGKEKKKMNKKIMGIIVAIVLVCALGMILFLEFNKKEKATTDNPTDNMENNSNSNVGDHEQDSNENDNESNNKKILVVYYSAQNHTKTIANKIADYLNADTFEIIPKQVYTSADLDWTNSSSRVSREHEDDTLRNIELVTTTVENWESYDTILIGYPIWWGIAAWPVNTFVKENDFANKTIIPFCTSASSGLGQSAELLEEEAHGGTWLNGHRFSSNETDTNIKSWTDSLK